MNVTTYITNDINYGKLYNIISGMTVIPSVQDFQYGDEIEFTCSHGGNFEYAFNGWFVFDASNMKYHREGRLPLYIQKGAQWKDTVSLSMNYGTDVIVVAELT
jgi:hypothetical protein